MAQFMEIHDEFKKCVMKNCGLHKNQTEKISVSLINASDK